MTLTALVGDCTTTTMLAVAANVLTDDRLVVEADRTGGSVAAWFDTTVQPSLSTVVASLRGDAGDIQATWTRIETLIRRSRSGVRFIPTPPRSIEAEQAIEEAERTVFPTVALMANALADVGRRAAIDGPSATLRVADTVVVCHRQATASAAAAGVRLERTAELVEQLAAGSKRLIVALIGDAPFELTEVKDYLSAAVAPVAIEAYQLPEDDLTAAVLAGRHGVSQKRFSRLPLIRACGGLAMLIGGEPTLGEAAES